MSRELQEYRDVLEELQSIFGRKTWIKLSELARAEGCDPRTCARRYGIDPAQGGIDTAILARRKCLLAK